MIEFMVIAAPRSGTTWAANWLCTDSTHCLHDPLSNIHYSRWDSIKSHKMLGVSDTGIAVFHHFLNAHPARKVILHRDLNEVNKSLESIGLSRLPDQFNGALDRINGMHVDWHDLFDNPKPIYEYLLRRPFDKERHDELKKIEMQPNWAGLTINKDVTKAIVNEIMEAVA